MSTVTVELDDDLKQLAQDDPRPLKDVLRELLVLELYRRDTISAGKAAEFLGMSKWEFIQFSGQRGIPYIRYSPEELERELQLLKDFPKQK